MSRGHGYVENSVSVVIVCFNRLDLTIKCFESIWESDDLPDEIVAVDNASIDDTGRWLEVAKTRSPCPLEIATLTQNVGWGRGANIGSQLAEGEYLLQLNNDTEVRPNWLTPLVAAMQPDIAVVAGKLLNPDGSIQHAGIELYDDTNGTLTARNIPTDQPAGEAECLSLAAALVNAHAWNVLGGMDPAFFCGYEDVDFSLRARERGWRLLYEPRSEVMHHGHASGPNRWAHTQDNIRLLHERWGHRWRENVELSKAGSSTA